MKVVGIIALFVGKFDIVLSAAMWLDSKYSDEFFLKIALGLGCLIFCNYLLNQAFRNKEAENK